MAILLDKFLACHIFSIEKPGLPTDFTYQNFATSRYGFFHGQNLIANRKTVKPCIEFFDWLTP